MDPTRIRTPSPVFINYTESSELPGRSGERRLPDLNLEPSAFDLDSLLSLAQELVSKQAAPLTAGQAPSEEDGRSSVCVFQSPPTLPRPPARECEPEGREPRARSGAKPPEELELRCLLDQRTDVAPSASHLRLRCFVTGGSHPRSEGGPQPAFQGPPFPSASSPQIPGSLLRDPPPSSSSSAAPGSFLQNFSRSCPRTPGSFLRDLAPSSSSPPDPSSLLQDLAPSYAAVSEMYRAAESIWDAEISVLSSADDYCPVSVPSHEPSRSKSPRDDWTSRGLRGQLERASRLQSWGTSGPGPAYGPESSQDPKPDYGLGSSRDPGPSPESASSPNVGLRTWACKDSGSKRCIWAPLKEEEVGGIPEPSHSPGIEQPDKGPTTGLSQSSISSLLSPNHLDIGILVPNNSPEQSPGGLVLEQIQSPGDFPLGQSPGGSSHGQSLGGSSRKHSPRGSVQGRSPGVSTPVKSPRNGQIQEQNPGEFSRRNSPKELVPELIQSPGDFPLGQSPGGSSHGQSLGGSSRKHSPRGSVQGRSPGVSTPVKSPRNGQIQEQNPGEFSRRNRPKELVPELIQSPGDFPLGQSPGGSSHGQSLGGSSRKHSPRGSVQGRSPGVSTPVQSPRNIQMQEQNPEEFSRKLSPAVSVPGQNLSPGGSSLGQSPGASLLRQSPKGSVQDQIPGVSTPIQSPSNIQKQEQGLTDVHESSRENMRGSRTSFQNLDDIEPFPLGKPDVPFLIRSEIDLVRRSAKSFSPSSQQRASVSNSPSSFRLSRQSAEEENTSRSFKTREHVDPFILQPPDDSKG